MALAQKNKEEPYSKDEHENQKYFQWTDCIPKTVQE